MASWDRVAGYGCLAGNQLLQRYPSLKVLEDLNLDAEEFEEKVKELEREDNA